MCIRDRVNAAVKFNINGVFYTKITNSEGIATLNIKLLPAEYKMCIRDRFYTLL